MQALPPNVARTCFVCRTYTPRAACAQCGQVIVCAQCENTQPMALRAHQAICFAITAPTGPLERIVTSALGGLGAVHQYVTALAWAALAATPAADTLRRLAATHPRLTARDLVAGVIFNDFPADDETDAAGTYLRTLEPIAPSDAPYIHDAQFLWQPTRDARWAAAAVYKGVPEALLAVAGVRHETVEHARRMLALRTHESHVNYHFMRASAHEIDTDVRRRAVASAERWFREAVLLRSFFPLGHICHMVEDSFSPAHTDRDVAETTVAQPYGVVHEVYFFGNQTDQWHSSRESIAAVQQPVGERRVATCARAVRDILQLYIAAVDTAPLLPPGGALGGAAQQAHAEHTAREFARFMKTQVFAL
jgi:hypothetical protein